MPFCYAIAKPLGVPAYAVGFGLSVPNHFFLSPERAMYFLYIALLYITSISVFRQITKKQ